MDGYLALYLCITKEFSVNKALAIVKATGVRPRRGLAPRMTWRYSQVAYIKANYKKLTDREMAEYLGLTRVQVRNKVKSLRRNKEIE